MTQTLNVNQSPHGGRRNGGTDGQGETKQEHISKIMNLNIGMITHPSSFALIF